MVSRGQRIGDPFLLADPTLDLTCLRLVLTTVCTSRFKPLSHLRRSQGSRRFVRRLQGHEGGFEDILIVGRGFRAERTMINTARLGKVPTASPAPSITWRFAGLSCGRYAS